LLFFSNRIRETTRSILRDETTSIFREVLAAQKNDINTILRQSLTLPKPVMSRTTTPLPTASVNISSPNVINTNSTSDVKQQHVLKLIRLNQINQAFEFVLSASDLNLVLYLCENIRSTELFSIQPCPLQTPVILSLIQQLSADLNTHQELKYRYLKKYFYSFLIISFSSYLYEALICLDLSHPSVRDYLQTVLIDLSKKLSTYIQTNPSTPMTKRFQLLLMASQGLVQKIVQQRATPSSLK
jgi:enhancer of mRNA-decapping protein 4